MPQHSIRTESDAALVSRRIAALHLGRWTEVRSSLFVRLVPSSATGPLAMPCDHAPDGALAFDFGLSVTDAAVTPSTSLVNRWLAEPDLDLQQIRQHGLRNTGRLLSARVVSRYRSGFRLTILSGGLFTTGAIAAPEQVLPRIGVVTTAGHRWLSALSATAVLVIDHDVASATSGHQEADRRVVTSVKTLCAEMVAITEQPLPANLFHVP